MCGRFTLATSARQVAEHFGLAEVPELSPRYNIAPNQSIAIVRRTTEREAPILEFRRWGLIPSWAKDPGIGSRMINARAETAAEKPAFRAAFRRRRCLVPADGFYEWKPHPKRRRPHHVRLAAGELFSLAGLFEAWKSPEGEAIESCTLLTTAANAVVGALHDRMPIVVDPEHYPRWLDPELQDPDSVLSLTGTGISDRLRFHAVDFRVNNPRNDDPSCIEPIEPAELQVGDF
jgi:putative SOS response-associated peptidase YedK